MAKSAAHSSSPGSIFLEIVRSVTPQGMEDFAALLQMGPQAIQDFCRNPEVISFLTALGNSGQQGQTLVGDFLAAPHAISGLANSGKAKAALRLIEAQPLEEQAVFLAAPYAISGLAANGEAEAALRLIEAQPLEQQAALLAAPYAIHGLAYGGQAKAVLRRIRAQPLEGQTALLAAPYAIRGLAANGEANALLWLIEAQPPEQQAALRAAPGAKRALHIISMEELQRRPRSAHSQPAPS